MTATDRSSPRISLVIPAYDEGDRLPPLLRDLVARLGTVAGVALETIVVDDGSRPGHSARMRTAVEAGARVLDGAFFGQRRTRVHVTRRLD